MEDTTWKTKAYIRMDPNGKVWTGFIWRALVDTVMNLRVP